MKKSVKVLCMMAIFVIVGSGIATMASAGLGIIPDSTKIMGLQQDILIGSGDGDSFMEEEKSLSSSVTTLKAMVEDANATDMRTTRSRGVEHIKSQKPHTLNYTRIYLNVKPQDVIKGDNVEFSAVLYDSSGKLVVNKALMFYIDGNFIESRWKTEPGGALISYDTGNLAVGTHKIKVVFEGDSQYRPSSEREIFMVNPPLWVESEYTRNISIGIPYHAWENYVENVTNVTITNATLSSASFTDDYADCGIDTDGDGKYNYLAIDVGVDVKNAGKYRIEGSLKDNSTGDYITWTSTDRILDVGMQNVTLRFNGYQIYSHGTSGWFDLKDLRIYDSDWNMLDYRNYAYATSYYSFTAFDVPPVDLAGSYSNYGIDTDGDGKYNYLAIDVWVNVKEAGRYWVYGRLEDGGGHYVTSEDYVTNLNTGLQKLTLQFNGYDIYGHGVNGPFTLDYIELDVYDDERWNMAEWGYNVYTTSFYYYTDFDKPPANLTGSYSDYGIDADGDGKYDYLAVDVWVNVKEAGYYHIGGWLDEDGNRFISYTGNSSYLDAGLQKLTLKFNGYEIYRHGVSGSYCLGYIELKDESWNIIDRRWDTYIASYYSYTDFDVPPIDLTGAYADYGVDTDGNGEYDYLVIEVGVNVKEAGTYNVYGQLNDNENKYITSAWAEADLGTGLQKFTLKFEGYKIYRNGVDGPFNLGYVALSDKWNKVDYKYDAYIASYYNYTEFDRKFTGDFRDYGLDTDEDGLYNYLEVEAEIDITKAGEYELRGDLQYYNEEKGYWEGIDGDWNETYLEAGIHNITLQFEGIRIYNTRYSGSFMVWLSLYEMEEWRRVDEVEYFTNDYDYTEFQKPPAEFAPGFNDYGLDTNSNTLYDYLVIEKEIKVREAGNYRLSGWLESPSGEWIYSDSNYTYLDVGLHSIKLQFYGPSIYTSEESGNFVVYMSLYDMDNGRWLDSTTNTTSYYSYTDFERPPAEFAPGFNDYGLDTNSNTLYDYLVIEKEITVREAGNYRLSGSLESPSGEWIYSDSNYTYLDMGLHSIKLQFYGPSIYNAEESGNFVVDMDLYETDDWRWLDSTTNTTSYYSYTDFERPSAELTGNFGDYGRDTDEDGLYNYLVVEAEVNITKAGEYYLYCWLRTPSGEGVDSDWNETYSDVGMHNITSKFRGLRIYNREYNGSFRAELELYVVEEWAKIDEAEYITANYNYTDFDPVMPPAIVSLTANPDTNISKDKPAVISATIIGDYLREITLFSGEKVKSNETTNTYELRSIEWIPSDEWSFVGNNTYNITAEWNATTVSFTEDGYYIGCYYATDGINETYPLIWELPAEYNVLNRTIYYSQLGLFFYNGTWYSAAVYYFSDTEKVEVVYVSYNLVFLNTTDPKLIEEFPDAKSLDPNSKCKFMNLLIITDSNGTITEDPFKYGEETRESKEFRIGDLEIKKNTPLPAGEYLIGMNVEDEAGNRDINGTTVFTSGIPMIFDTGPGTYPSIFGTHNGTIIPSSDLNVSKLYTYPCPGTGGHTESIELYENGTLIANGTWNGYKSDWHNITIHNVTGASYVMLLEEHEYNYVIKTGSYPQIIHEQNHTTLDCSFINCTKFTDANGKKYNNWIPAIRLH